jgi:hypothetical protein
MPGSPNGWRRGRIDTRATSWRARFSCLTNVSPPFLRVSLSGAHGLPRPLRAPTAWKVHSTRPWRETPRAQGSRVCRVQSERAADRRAAEEAREGARVPAPAPAAREDRPHLGPAAARAPPAQAATAARQEGVLQVVLPAVVAMAGPEVPAAATAEEEAVAGPAPEVMAAGRVVVAMAAGAAPEAMAAEGVVATLVLAGQCRDLPASPWRRPQSRRDNS